MTRQKLKSLLNVTAALALTALGLWLSFRSLDPEIVFDALRRVHPLWAGSAVCLSIGLVSILAWRWQRLLLKQKKIFHGPLFQYQMISQYINILFPGRFGELVRSYLVSRRYRISGSFVLGTVAVEKVCDFFIFLILWISIPPLLSFQKGLPSYRTALVAAVLTALALLVLIFRPSSVRRIFEKGSSFLPQRLHTKFSALISEGISSFSQLRRTRTLVEVCVLTLLVVFGQVLLNFILFKAFDIPASPWAALLVLLAVQLGSLPPSVPGKFGVFEYSIIIALSLFDVPKSQALTYGLSLHIIAYLPKILFGASFLSHMKDFKLTDFRKKPWGDAQKI